jgi:hypothetical protein
MPAEIKMILPLMNVAQKELPILSQLMFDAYTKPTNGFSDVEEHGTWNSRRTNGFGK